MPTNETIGISVQAAICKFYGIDPGCDLTGRSDPKIEQAFAPEIKPLFKLLGSTPVRCRTWDRDVLPGARSSPVNFELKDGQTLKLNTTTKRQDGKVCPAIVGQPGDDALQTFFSDWLPASGSSSLGFKQMVLQHVADVFPQYLDFLFWCDWLSLFHYDAKGNAFTRLEALHKSSIQQLGWDPQRFSFTKPTLTEWSESNTIRYDGESIAEAQVHTHRKGYKFRFVLDTLLRFIRKKLDTNETFGISAEQAIAEMFGLAVPPNFAKRADSLLVQKVRKALAQSPAFQALPVPMGHSGSQAGQRGGASKSSVDFILHGGKTLSVKTNWGGMVCPSEVGQPGTKTFLLYFGHLLSEAQRKAFGADAFKALVLGHCAALMPIYAQHLFDCDHLLWIKDRQGGALQVEVLDGERFNAFQWDSSKFAFSQTLESWNESCSVSYDGVPLGNFQAHRHRSSYKFRFNLANLIRLTSRSQGR